SDATPHDRKTERRKHRRTPEQTDTASRRRFPAEVILEGAGMGIEKEFLADIREHPDDDAPRLIYADWLDDHGDEARAEFIRVQCALARQARPERRAELERREHELLSANRQAWLGPLDSVLQYDHCTFRRGFPEDLAVRPRVMV